MDAVSRHSPRANSLRYDGYVSMSISNRATHIAASVRAALLRGCWLMIKVFQEAEYDCARLTRLC